jgi:UDP-2,3-diacylglucosamine pyrophosphatase LpxH
MSRWSLAFVSDIHVRASSSLTPERFVSVVQNLAGFGLRFVVMGGDATSGNEGDGHDGARVASWWQSFKEALLPLRDAGVPVLPIAGNHDYYTGAHKQGYAEAWAEVASGDGARFDLRGQPPFSYWFVEGDVFFLFLHVVDQALSQQVEAFAREALATVAAQQARLRLCFGHVPLVSMMGRSNLAFCEQLGRLLAEGGVAAYFSGHEHLFWDQLLPFGELNLRQIHVGTASGAYHFPLSQSVYAAHCQGDRGTLPNGGLTFELIPGTRQQKDEVTLALIDIHLDEGPGYSVKPLTLRNGLLHTI